MTIEGPGPQPAPATAPGQEGPPTLGHLLALLEEIIEDVESARSVPLSGAAMLDRDVMLSKLRRLKAELPEDMRAARWMVRKREQFIARTNEQAREVIEQAREQAKAMVEESYIVREAVEEANRLVRSAETESSRIRLEAEDFAERAFEEAETVLGELLHHLRASRAELHESLPPEPEPPISR